MDLELSAIAFSGKKGHNSAMLRPLSLWITLTLLAIPIHAKGLELLELFEKAKKFNPDIQRVNLETDFQKARVQELKSAFLPQLSIEGVYFYGNVPLNSERGKSGFDRIDNQNAISLRTTLYNGGAEYTYFKYKEILPALAKNQKNSELFGFFLSLSALYFDYLNISNQEKLIARQIESLRKRAKLLKRWSKIGRVRKADYLSTLTQLMALEGRQQELVENLKTGQLNLRALTGQTVESSEISLPFEKFSEVPTRGSSSDISLRPEYKLLESSIQNQLQNITIQEATLRPQIDFRSNYYINRRQFGRQDDWDVAVTFSWNFFDFGATKSRVEQERVRLRQIQSDLQRAKINLSNEMEIVETRFRNQLKRKALLKSSFEVAQQNYNEQRKEFKKGLIDALDLNRALEQMI
ncbi:MAG: TolC family protein, partial [Halobacteriovoraceae bacterium]|nr:TolC family protein [Halobacteriovoraceae bacterium]